MNSVIVGNSQERKIYCTCGYEGMAHRKKTICPACQKKADVNLTKRTEATVPQLSKTENEDTMTILFKPVTYHRVNLNFSTTNHNFKLVLNKHNGDCMLFKEDENYLIPTKINYPPSYYNDFICLLGADKGIVKQIVESLFLARGIVDLNPKDFAGERFPKVFLFLKYPALQFLDANNIYLPEDPEKLKVIEQAKGKIELVESLVGHKSKRVLKALESHYSFNFAIKWGPYIKNPDHLLYFIENIDFGTSSRERFLNLNGEFRTNFITGITLIKNLHQNQEDKIWIDRLLKPLSKWAKGYLETTVENYIVDIGRMYYSILNKSSDYQIQFDKDIKKLHDDLAKDYSRLQIKNEKIVYKSTELSLEKKLDEKSKIILAPDTHYLMDVGSEMSICVGSYHKEALRKKCNILVLEEEDKPVLCIEVREGELIQAKLKYNKLPTGKYRDTIIAWCEEKQIDYHDCSDIAQ